MKTNFQMLRTLIKEKNFTPKSRSCLSDSEVKFIEETLCLNEMDILALRNLRDFTVMWLCDIDSGEKSDAKDFRNIMSGITAVIDRNIFRLGGEV